MTGRDAGAAGLRRGHFAVVVEAAERQHDAQQQPDGHDQGRFWTAPSRMSSSTTPRGYWLSAARANTRATWLVSNIASNTPVTDEPADDDFTQDVAIENPQQQTTRTDLSYTSRP